MKRHAGFTIVELIITITIMTILVTLAVVNLTSGLAEGRDEERKTDVENIIRFQESAYNRSTTRSYFPSASTSTEIDTWYDGIDKNNLRAPDATPNTYSLVIAGNTAESATGVSPQPLDTTYVYQPLKTDGTICHTAGECRRFNIYYRDESTNTTVMLTSRSQ